MAISDPLNSVSLDFRNRAKKTIIFIDVYYLCDRASGSLMPPYCFPFLQGYEGSLLKVTSKNGKTSSVSES